MNILDKIKKFEVTSRAKNSNSNFKNKKVDKRSKEFSEKIEKFNLANKVNEHEIKLLLKNNVTVEEVEENLDKNYVKLLTGRNGRKSGCDMSENSMNLSNKKSVFKNDRNEFANRMKKPRLAASMPASPQRGPLGMPKDQGLGVSPSSKLNLKRTTSKQKVSGRKISILTEQLLEAAKQLPNPKQS